MSAATTLRQFLRELTAGAFVTLDDQDHPPWFDSGVINEVDEDTYCRFLELLPPRYMNGNCFCFGEGSGNFRLFWQRRGRYFGRELPVPETERFCQLAGISPLQ